MVPPSKIERFFGIFIHVEKGLEESTSNWKPLMGDSKRTGSLFGGKYMPQRISASIGSLLGGKYKKVEYQGRLEASSEEYMKLRSCRKVRSTGKPFRRPVQSNLEAYIFFAVGWWNGFILAACILRVVGYR